jgi:large subunit ribosomal protein L25
LPEGLPSAIEIPVEHLRIGHKLAVSQVPSEGFEILNSPHTIIVSVKRSRNAVMEDEEEEGEEAAAEGAEAAEAAE